MSKQNKKSIKQVIRGEYKIIGLFILIFLLFPLISEIALISDLNRFNSLSVLEKVGALLGLTDFTFTNVDILSLFSLVVTIVAVPLFAIIMARKLNGQRLLHAIRDGFKDLGTKRPWNYILKVYLPYIAVIAVVVIGVSFISDQTILNVVSNLVQSTALSVVVIILVAVLSVVVASISGTLFVAFVAYLRGAPRIKAVFNAIPSREINKLLVFNLVEVLTGILILGCFIVPALLMEPLNLIQSVVSMIIGLLVAIIIYQIVFLYLKFSIYMNIASKIETRQVVITKEKQIDSTPVLETVESEAVTEDVFVAKTTPKKAKRKNRLTAEQISENKIKPKRSIK